MALKGLLAEGRPYPSVVQRHRRALPRCDDRSHAITTAAPLSGPRHSTSHRVLRSALGVGPTPRRDRSRLPRAPGAGASTSPDSPAGDEVLFFHSLMTVLGLTCNTLSFDP